VLKWFLEIRQKILYLEKFKDNVKKISRKMSRRVSKRYLKDI